MMLKIISANRLADGVVVYYVSQGLWTAELAQAKSFALDADLEAALSLAKADEKRNLIVDPFAVEVKAADSASLEPLSLRNAIRAKGPTVPYQPRSNSPRSH